MRHRIRNRESDEEKAARCLAHGIAHARATFGRRRLATILGTIALELAASADAAASAATPVQPTRAHHDARSITDPHF